MKKWFFIFTVVFPFLSIYSQDYGWWNELVDWDGKQAWPEYLLLSTGGLGPNALPVPEFHNESISEKIKFNFEISNHFHPHESTQSLFASIEFPFSKRVAFKAWMVPLERYQMDTILRNERKIREFDPRGFSSGDLYVGTFINLLREGDLNPEIIFSANLKTASGNNIEAGRVTETPGYYFDLLLVKTFNPNENLSVRPYVAGGIYVYQTFDVLHFQNDAFLYSLGMGFQYGSHYAKADMSGYSGYLEIKDKPVVLRMLYRKRINEIMSINTRFAHGLRDYPYTSISIGCVLEI